jgi:transcriptional regulator with XRE-family HTH domain
MLRTVNLSFTRVKQTFTRPHETAILRAMKKTKAQTKQTKVALGHAVRLAVNVPIDAPKEPIGGAAELARRLGVTGQAVSQWKRSGVVPLTRAAAIEQLFAGAVSRKELCPEFPW